MALEVLEPQPMASSTTADTPAAEGPQHTKNFWQLLSIAIGFLGIQFAYSVQIAKTTPIMESLGSAAWLTGWIWCAGPVTGTIIQPLVGALSDKTWIPGLGRRRPFLLLGALLTAICLVMMPNVKAIAGVINTALNAVGLDGFAWVLEGGQPVLPLLLAAASLWILDASINTSQGPYRALVPDTVAKPQQAFTFSLMSLMIGLGAVIAFWLSAKIDRNLLFYLGAAAMVLAMVWTSITTPEYPRTTVADAEETTEKQSLSSFFKSTFQYIVTMPSAAKKLCLAHSFTWFGLMCMFVFFVPYVSYQVFGAANPNDALFAQGESLAGWCYMYQNVACLVFSPLISPLAKAFGKKPVHAFGLACLAGSLMSMFFLKNPVGVQVAMGLAGIGWATTLSLPFALLADHIPEGNEGVLTGAFNIFIAAPQFVAAPLVGYIVSQTGLNSLALLIGGASVFLSALLLQLVPETRYDHATEAV